MSTFNYNYSEIFNYSEIPMPQQHGTCPLCGRVPVLRVGGNLVPGYIVVEGRAYGMCACPGATQFVGWLKERAEDRVGLRIVGDPHDPYAHPIVEFLRARGLPAVGFWNYEITLGGERGSIHPLGWMLAMADALRRHPRMGLIKAEEAIALLGGRARLTFLNDKER